jgi:hypothetical protein
MSTTTKIDFIDYLRINAAEGTSPTTGKMIVGCNGKVYFGGYGSWTASTSSAYNNAAVEITTVGASGDWYLVDGTNIRKILGTDGTVSSLTASVGTLPSNPRIVTLYRNRLVFARTSSDPHNWFMSRVGDYEDWDDAEEDVAAAVTGNNSDAGTIGDTITALIPFSDDYMVMGCSDSVWLMRGDPKSGGRIDSLTRGGGIVGPTAWAKDAEGSIYYLTHTDIMRIAPGGSIPESISENKIQHVLSQIDFSLYTARMAWDQLNKGLWVFFTKATSAAVVHLYWDRRTGGFTTHSFPNDHGPTAICDLAGVVYQERQIIMGGFDGKLRTMDPGWTTDDGQAISSYAQLPPVVFAEPGAKGVLMETEIVLGNVPLPHVLTEWYVGDNAQAAIQAAILATAPTLSQATTGAGRFLYRGRARGQAGVFRLSNSAIGRTWAYESGCFLVSRGGRTR